MAKYIKVKNCRDCEVRNTLKCGVRHEHPAIYDNIYIHKDCPLPEAPPDKGKGEPKCELCSKPIPDYKPKYCCSGKDCACLGKPIDPPWCDECWDKVMKPPAPKKDSGEGEQCPEYIQCKQEGCLREVKKQGDYCGVCRGI